MSPRPSIPLLDVSGLIKHFPIRKPGMGKSASLKAVDGVTFQVMPGEAYGLVGESGCGKSTVARALLRLIEPDAGQVRFDGSDVSGARGRELVALRRRMQIVFQDPFSSLNPRRSIGQTLAEPIRVHGLASGAAIHERTAALMEEVGLPEAALERYPHEFSGGQRQRIGIARALTVEPQFLVMDEPVSALDVSIQAQMLLLLRDLQQKRGLTFIFVSHDLGVVRWFCDRVGVMYLGRIIEDGSVGRIFNKPRHPYSRMLRDASPVPDPSRRGALARIEGEIPSAASPPSGCHFHPRCGRATDLCKRLYPSWTSGEEGGFACHHPLTE
jgi:peptide/nickel transport system ATP-binding protein